MGPAVIRTNARMGELLHERAFTASRTRLLIDVIGGALVVLAATIARPKGWVVLGSAGLCFLAYGVWASAERHLAWQESPLSVRVSRTWRATRAGALVVGVVAIVFLMFSVLYLALGTWIS